MIDTDFFYRNLPWVAAVLMTLFLVACHLVRRFITEPRRRHRAERAKLARIAEEHQKQNQNGKGHYRCATNRVIGRDAPDNRDNP